MVSDLMKKISQVFLVYLLTWGLVFPSFIFAADLPTGGTITGGQATITTGATNLDINQSSSRAVSEWNNFSIGNGFTVNVNQCPSCAHLARDVGGDISSIYGTLNAQGAFWLSNSRGIYVGQSGVFNVGNLLLSTLNISGQDFMAGNYHFAQDPNSPLAYILNKGTITAANGGYVALLAPSIMNEGIIGANLGKVYGIAGEEAVLNFGGDSLIGFTVDGPVTEDIIGPDGQPVSSNIMNNGIITANGGEVVLKANTAYGVIKSVVNNSGVIEANSFSTNNGRIVLDGGDSGIVENSGTITASAAEAGANGGVVTITGDVIRNSGNITADAGDNATAGDIDVIAGSLLTLEGTSRLSARGADINSDGGDIYLWSNDDAFALAGQVIDISGGTTSGNGGTAELSSSDHVTFGGSVLGYSQDGNQGSFVIDPANASISGNVAADTTVWADTDITITGNVTVDTTAGNVTLYLLADHQSGAVGDWQAGGGFGTIQNSGGTWTITDSVSNGNTAAVQLYASDWTASGVDIIGTDASPITLMGMDETVIAVRNDVNGSNGNDVFLAGDDLMIRGDMYLGNLDLETTGTINQSAALTNIATLDINAGGTVNLSNAGNDVQTLTAVTSNDAITFTDTDDFAITTVNAGANTVTLTSGNGISDGGGADPNITATTLTVLGGSTFGMGDTIETAVSTLALTTANTYIDNTGALTVNNSTVGGALTITNSSSIALNNVNAGGNTVNLTAGGAITDANGAGNNITATTLNIMGNQNTDLDTTVSNLDLTTATTNISNTGALTVTDSTVTGQLDLTGSSTMVLNNISAAGQAVNLTAGGATDVNGDITGSSVAITLAADSLLTVAATSSITATNSVTLISDEMELNSTGADIINATAGGGTITLRAVEDDTVLTLGSGAGADISGAGAAGTLALDSTDIAALSDTVGQLQFGAEAQDGNTTITNGGATLTINAPLVIYSNNFGFNANGDALATDSTLVLYADGAITDAAGVDTTTDITATNFNIAESASVGTSTTDALNLSVNNLVNLTSAGSAYVTEFNGLGLGTANVGAANNLWIEALSGNISDINGGLNVTAGSVTFIASSATGGVGTAVDAIETSVGSLNTDTAANNRDAYITETNGLTDLNINAGAGTVVLTLTAGAIVDTAADAE
ncbi:MAG: hypothetical protein HY807_09920, partial [Nitrospirae bacterium]|nr:hypothetical protein [Nitrospirota bacterium]